MALRRQVVARARRRCEYCGLSSLGQAATLHVDHIIPNSAGGPGAFANLALACVHRSLRKGARQTPSIRKPDSPHPSSTDPRREQWNHHFRWSGTAIIGINATARATIAALSLNSPDHRIIRAFEAKLGRHPPPGHL